MRCNVCFVQMLLFFPFLKKTQLTFSYEAHTYNFPLLPVAFGPVDSCFVMQVGKMNTLFENYSLNILHLFSLFCQKLLYVLWLKFNIKIYKQYNIYIYKQYWCLKLSIFYTKMYYTINFSFFNLLNILLINVIYFEMPSIHPPILKFHYKFSF